MLDQMQQLPLLANHLCVSPCNHESSKRPLAMETGAEPRRWHRKRYTKTKFGCKTCKIRKVRCDETWPTCQNCAKTGRQCDGVSPQAIGKRSNSVTFAPPLTVSHFQPKPARDLHGQDAPSAQSLRNRLIHCVVGELSRPLWKPLMAQAVVRMPAMEETLQAFGALCRGYTQAKRDLVAWEPREADIKESVRASICMYYGMSQLTWGHRDGADGFCGSVNMAALCNAMCICFELIMNDAEAALHHLDRGMEMLRHETFQMDENLVLLFTRLHLNASNFPGVTQSPDHAAPLAHAERTFHELDTNLTCTINNLLILLRTRGGPHCLQNPGVVPLDYLVEAKKLEAELHEYRARIAPPQTAACWTRHVVCSPLETAYLRMRFSTGILISTITLWAEECIFDTLLDEFSAILDSSAYLLREREQGPGPDLLAVGTTPEDMCVSQNAQPDGAAFSTAAVQALYMTACKCRSSSMRHAAIALIEGESRSKGSLKSARVYAAIGRRIMQLEEACSGEDRPEVPAAVPEWCRIHTVKIGSAVVEADFAEVLFRYRPNGIEGEWFEFWDVVTWGKEGYLW